MIFEPGGHILHVYVACIHMFQEEQDFMRKEAKHFLKCEGRQPWSVDSFQTFWPFVWHSSLIWDPYTTRSCTSIHYASIMLKTIYTISTLATTEIQGPAEITPEFATGVSLEIVVWRARGLCHCVECALPFHIKKLQWHGAGKILASSLRLT